MCMVDGKEKLNTIFNMLSIEIYFGQTFPNSIYDEGLVKIFLKECRKCEMLPMLGQP